MEASPTRVSDTEPRPDAAWQPGLKHDHVFVVFRVEGGPDWRDSPLQHRIAATRAFFSREEAEAETERLNQVNADKGCVYFSTVARLERPAESRAE